MTSSDNVVTAMPCSRSSSAACDVFKSESRPVGPRLMRFGLRPIGPCSMHFGPRRAIRSNSLAQRARSRNPKTTRHGPTGRPFDSPRSIGEWPARWAWTIVGGCRFPGPLAQAIGTAGPLGRIRKPPARWPVFDVFWPFGPDSQTNSPRYLRPKTRSQKNFEKIATVPGPTEIGA